MPKIIIKFPQIVVEQKEVEVSQEKYESLIEDRKDISKFIWDNLTEQEQGWSIGYRGIDSSVDCGFCGVYKKEVKL